MPARPSLHIDALLAPIAAPDPVQSPAVYPLPSRPGADGAHPLARPASPHQARSSGGSGSAAASRQPSCTNCYQRKIRCPKDKPVCATCIRRGVASSCVYVDRRELPAHIRPPPRKPSRSMVGPSTPASAPAFTAATPTRDHAHKTRDADKDATPAPGGASPSGAESADPSTPAREKTEGAPDSPEEAPPSIPAGVDMDALAESVAERMSSRVADLVAARLLPVLSVAHSRSQPSASSGSAPSTLPNAQLPGGSGGTASTLIFPCPGTNVGGSSSYVAKALDALPPDDVLDWAVEYFLRELEPLHGAVVGGILLDQIAGLKKERVRRQDAAAGRRGRAYDDDPALAARLTTWATLHASPLDADHAVPVAVLTVAYAVLANVTTVVSPYSLIQAQTSQGHSIAAALFSSWPEDGQVEETRMAAASHGLDALRTGYLQVAQTLLAVGRWAEYPTVTSLQAVIILRPVWMALGLHVSMSSANAVAIKAASFKGLHRLGCAKGDGQRWKTQRQKVQFEKQEAAQTIHHGPVSVGLGGIANHSRDADGPQWISENGVPLQLPRSMSLANHLLTELQTQLGHAPSPESASPREKKAPSPQEQEQEKEQHSTERDADHSLFSTDDPDRARTQLAGFGMGHHAVREVGRKVWWSLVSLDWLLGSRFDLFYLVDVAPGVEYGLDAHLHPWRFPPVPKHVDDAFLRPADVSIPARRDQVQRHSAHPTRSMDRDTSDPDQEHDGPTLYHSARWPPGKGLTRTAYPRWDVPEAAILEAPRWGVVPGLEIEGPRTDDAPDDIPYGPEVPGDHIPTDAFLAPPGAGRHGINMSNLFLVFNALIAQAYKVFVDDVAESDGEFCYEDLALAEHRGRFIFTHMPAPLRLSTQELIYLHAVTPEVDLPLPKGEKELPYPQFHPLPEGVTVQVPPDKVLASHAPSPDVAWPPPVTPEEKTKLVSLMLTHHLCLRSNRFYMSRGFDDPAYARSSYFCVNAAWQLLRIARRLITPLPDAVPWPPQSSGKANEYLVHPSTVGHLGGWPIWFVVLYVFHAAIVLQMYAVHRTNAADQRRARSGSLQDLQQDAHDETVDAQLDEMIVWSIRAIRTSYLAQARQGAAHSLVDTLIEFRRQAQGMVETPESPAQETDSPPRKRRRRHAEEPSWHRGERGDNDARSPRSNTAPRPATPEVLRPGPVRATRSPRALEQLLLGLFNGQETQGDWIRLDRSRRRPMGPPAPTTAPAAPAPAHEPLVASSLNPWPAWPGMPDPGMPAGYATDMPIYPTVPNPAAMTEPATTTTHSWYTHLMAASANGQNPMASIPGMPQMLGQPPAQPPPDKLSPGYFGAAPTPSQNGLFGATWAGADTVLDPVDSSVLQALFR